MNPILAAFVGEQVMIRYDPRDLAEIRVYLDGKFICPTICQDIADLVVSLKDIRKARQKIRRTLRGEINQAKQIMKKLADDVPNNKKASNKKSSKPKKSRIKLYRNE